MSALSDKSNLNISAAELLYKENHYDSVCHPAYYACLQLIKHTLCKNGISLEQQAIEASSSYRGNTHQYLIEKMKLMVNNKRGTNDGNDFRRKIRDLKLTREDSDYKDIRISSDTSRKSINLAKELQLIIQSV